MMGHREKMKSGDEYDALTKARKHYGPVAGVVRWVKQKFNRRVRRDAKQQTRGEADRARDAV